MKVSSVNFYYIQKQNFCGATNNFSDRIEQIEKNSTIFQRKYKSKNIYYMTMLCASYDTLNDKNFVLDYDKKSETFSVFLKQRQEKGTSNIFQILKNMYSAKKEFVDKKVPILFAIVT